MDLLKTALENLPHGVEFRFVDELVQLNPGKNGQGCYLVRGDEPFLNGHFPGNPLFPGVLLVEAVAQLAGVVAQCDPQIAALPGLKLTAIRGAKILGSAKPGQRLEIHAEVIGRMGNLIQAKGEILVAGQKILTTDVVLSGDV